MNQSNLVTMSGCFWKVTVSGDFVELISTIKGYRARFSINEFIRQIVRSQINFC